MQKRTKRLMVGAPGVFLSIYLLAGCAMIQRNEAMQQERLLSAAGFHMELADTPGRLAKVAAMPQRKLIAKRHNNKIHWTYADSKYCKCLFTGNEKDYQHYQYLLTWNKIAQMNEAAAVNGGAWGPWWGPWGGPWGP